MKLFHKLIIPNYLGIFNIKMVILYTKGVLLMISYQPFYETLFKKNVTEYALIFKYGIPANTVHRMKHNKPITTTTLNTLCEILDCKVDEVIEYIPDEKI